MSALGEQLARLWESARAPHPGVEVPPDEYLRYVAARLAPASASASAPASGSQPQDRLGELHAADLYLACACLGRDAEALRTFEKRCLFEARRALQRISGPLTTPEDVLQEVLVRLLVTDSAGCTPKLASYAGRGSLSAWIRIVATREALMLLRRTRRPPLDELSEVLTEPGAAPELDYLKRRCRKEFQEALYASLKQLMPRDRNLLRHHLVHRLSIDDIGALYRINRATAARWLEKSRRALFTATRDRMMQQTQMPAAEFDSILRFIDSQLDASIVRLLQEQEIEDREEPLHSLPPRAQDDRA